MSMWKRNQNSISIQGQTTGRSWGNVDLTGVFLS
jgi:hypothetical protein